MIAESSRSPSSGPIRSGVSKPLKRGKACSVCRALKIKCDGARSICGPCAKNPKPDPCEYDNGLGKSRTRCLEETISRLEARVFELENPEAATPSVTLHDPYGRFSQNRFSDSPPIHAPEPSHAGPHSPFSPTSTTSSLPSGSSTSISPSRQLIPISPSSSNEEPPQPLIQFLLEKFLPHAAEFGFFLDISSFHHSALLSHPFGHHLRPSPALLTTVYLWGCHLSRPRAPPQVDESVLLIRALRHVVTDTLGNHPRRILHTIQAEVLLATYFFRTGRFLEAKSRLGSAVSLALGSQLHRLRSANYPPLCLIGINSEMPVLPQPPQSTVEEGEHINGFWAVFTLHKMLSVALDPPSGVCGALETPGLQIDVPWPFDSHDYKMGCLSNDIQGNSTVKFFLAGYSFNARNDTSLTALAAKASILCHRATHLTGQWGPNMPKREYDSFSAAFRSVDGLIDDFRTRIPSLTQPGANTANTRISLLIHSLTSAATIKLHGTFSYADPVSNQKCVQAACDMVDFRGIDLSKLGFVNSVYGALWQMACQVFIDELSRRQTTQVSWPTSISEEDLRNNLKIGLHALSVFSKECAYIRYQRLKVDEAYTATNSTLDYLSSALTPSQ